MRILWFIFCLVFLQPAYSNSVAEECKSGAERLKRISELRDRGLNHLDAIKYMVINWDDIEDEEKKMVLGQIVFVFHTHKDLKPSELHKVALELCYKQNGIVQAGAS